MQRWKLEECAAVPWENGGGLTRELAARRTGGGVLWRLSVAEITKDGPFSAFVGMARVHTIIEGAGLDLDGETGVLHARPFVPLQFDGGVALEASLLDGPCQAFNVIYDPQSVAVDVNVHACEKPLDVAVGDFVYMAAGSASMERGSRLIAEEAISPEVPITLYPNSARLLHVRFRPVTN